ncbi:MAG TPA: ABC transporter substrate-binding protein [Stellaceae bacterium]|nr:ABC transporter substrate-binding protein [Stellaceae bacterium]
MASLLVDRRRLLAGAGCLGAMLPLRAGTAAADTRKLDVVATQGVTGLTLDEIAHGQGFFEEFGVAPNLLRVSDSSKCIAALLSGTCKLCAWSGFNQLLPAIERGAKIKILAGSLNLPSLAIYSGKKDITAVKDLAGRSIGIGAPGAVLHQMTMLLLKKKGVDTSKIAFRNVGSNADILKAVIAGTVDAGLSDVDAFDQQERYGIHALTDGLLWREIPEYTNQATYASDTAIQGDRDTIVRMLAAYAKTYRYVSSPNSQDVFIKAWQKITSSADAKAAITQWNWIQKYQPYAVNLVLSDDQIDLVQKLNIDFTVQKRILPVDQIADMSLAKDALKLLG